MNDLRKEDEFFHTENNEVEIQLLDHLAAADGENMELLENFHIDIGKDGKEIYETFDNGKSKTRFSATDLKELKKKEMEFLQNVQDTKSRVDIKKEPLFSKELDAATSIEDNYKVRYIQHI